MSEIQQSSSSVLRHLQQQIAGKTFVEHYVNAAGCLVRTMHKWDGKNNDIDKITV